MSKYRSCNWPQLFAEFEQSGLSQKAFCSQHQINLSYFSARLAKRKAREAGAFAQVVVASENHLLASFVLEVGQCKSHCPAGGSMPALVSPLIRQSILRHSP